MLFGRQRPGGEGTVQLYQGQTRLPLVLFYAEDRIEYLDAIKGANYERYGKLKTFILGQCRKSLERAKERGLLV